MELSEQYLNFYVKTTFGQNDKHISKEKTKDTIGNFMTKSFFLFLLFFITTIYKSVASDDYSNSVSQGVPSNLPEVNIHSITSPPGELLLQVDALNFTGTNGQISAITLRIQIDTMLIAFVGIQNYTIQGTWMANYNQLLHEITIVYTAASGMGYDLNGKLLDLQVFYQGGFTANLEFKPNCEVSNKNLMTIADIGYGNGSITQSTPVGFVKLESTSAYLGQIFPVPIIIAGEGYGTVNEIELLISFDSTKMSFQGYQLGALAGIEVAVNKNLIFVQWTDTLNPENFIIPINLLDLQFLWLGQGNTELAFQPGSKVKNSLFIFATDFINGQVNELYQVITSAFPYQGGITSGDGFYGLDSLVSVSAASNPNFSFAYWTKGSDIVSYDSLYQFSMQAENIILTADFIAYNYQLTLVVAPTGTGWVTGGGNYAPGELVTVSALPGPGFIFLNWTLNNAIISTQPSFQFTMPASNVTLIANFVPTVYELALAVSPINAGIVNGAGNYLAGEMVSVSAVANQGYGFLNWTLNGDVISWLPDYIFQMPANNVLLIANFQLTAFQLVLESLPFGAGFLTGGGLYNPGDQIMINAVALPGYEFVNWTNDGNVVSTLPSFIFTMPASNVILVANFIMTGYQLALQPFPTGSGQVFGGGIYNQGEVVAVSAFAEPGYTFENWTQDGITVSTQTAFNFTMPGNDATLQANFELTGFNLSLEVVPPAAGQSIGAGLYNFGEIASISAIANPGFKFLNWKLGTTVISTLPNMEYLMPASDVTLTANFEYVAFHLTVEANPALAAQLTGSGIYDFGNQVNVSALGNPGYFFLNWTKDGTIISNQPSFVFAMPASDVLLMANFVMVEYKVSLLVEPENAGVVSGDGFYSSGELVNIHAVPVASNSFLNWSINGSIISLQPNYSFVMPANDIGITANFSVKMFTIAANPNNPVYGTVSGEGEYQRSSVATITATPSTDYRFILWAENEGILSYENPLSFVVDTNRNLVAYFQIDGPCVAPVDLNVSEIGKITAMLHWIPAANENSWKILWGLRNFDTVNGGTVSGGIPTNSYLLENLVPDTGYDVYVKAVCNTSQSSRWEGPERFSTIPLGINSVKNEDYFKIFPNPANDFIFIKYSSETEMVNNLRVIDSRGIVVINRQETIPDNYCLQLGGIGPGVYVLQLISETHISNITFIVY